MLERCPSLSCNYDFNFSRSFLRFESNHNLIASLMSQPTDKPVFSAISLNASYSLADLPTLLSKMGPRYQRLEHAPAKARNQDHEVIKLSAGQQNPGLASPENFEIPSDGPAFQGHEGDGEVERKKVLRPDGDDGKQSHDFAFA
jgi:hypothetical protein